MVAQRLILGIDTSCDDTGVGVVADGLHVRSNVRASQELAHRSFGGVVPSVAARKHGMSVHPLIELSLERAGVTLDELDAIAVTNEQGLAPALAVGVAAAKGLAIAIGRPLVPVHHVDAHVYSIEMAFGEAVRYPFLCLAVAGGHTMLLDVRGRRDYVLVGGTRDDAAGEVLDKFARELEPRVSGRSGDRTGRRTRRPGALRISTPNGELAVIRHELQWT